MYPSYGAQDGSWSSNYLLWKAWVVQNHCLWWHQQEDGWVTSDQAMLCCATTPPIGFLGQPGIYIVDNIVLCGRSFTLDPKTFTLSPSSVCRPPWGAPQCCAREGMISQTEERAHKRLWPRLRFQLPVCLLRNGMDKIKKRRYQKREVWLKPGQKEVG